MDAQTVFQMLEEVENEIRHRFDEAADLTLRTCEKLHADRLVFEIMRCLPPIIETSPVIVWDEPLYNMAIRGAPEAFRGAKIEDWNEFTNQIWVLPSGRIKCLAPKKIGPDPWAEGRFAVVTSHLMYGPGTKPVPITGPDGERVTVVIVVATALKDGPRPEAPPFGFIWGVPVQNQPLDDPATEIVAANRFLQQELVETRPESLPRGDRRRLEKQDRPVPDIRTVLLRRKRIGPEGPRQSPIEWTCQWTVKGHWRANHWNKNEPIYVNPYVKGPSDKPLKPRSEALYQVVR